jgi:hypothetical protein
MKSPFGTLLGTICGINIYSCLNFQNKVENDIIHGNEYWFKIPMC